MNLSPVSSRRALCPQCQRPVSACICHCVQSVPHATEVLVLQHPMEAAHPKGTARLLHLCLPHSRMLQGESWSAEDLHPWLHAPWQREQTPAPAATAAPALTLLLYPPSPPDTSLPLIEPPHWQMDDVALLPSGSKVRLVVIDGTWRKSRKMLYLNPALQQLPRLPLLALPSSRYAIRKAHAPGQLSTLEATWAALQQLEPHNNGLQPLLGAMDKLQQLYLRSIRR